MCGDQLKELNIEKRSAAGNSLLMKPITLLLNPDVSSSQENDITDSSESAVNSASFLEQPQFDLRETHDEDATAAFTEKNDETIEADLDEIVSDPNCNSGLLLDILDNTSRFLCSSSNSVPVLLSHQTNLTITASSQQELTPHYPVVNTGQQKSVLPQLPDSDKLIPSAAQATHRIVEQIRGSMSIDNDHQPLPHGMLTADAYHSASNDQGNFPTNQVIVFSFVSVK